ncbi:MAG: hypothetical protein KDA42_05520 [Planctomycetales bacterium]|nr:hypothetical protein [Planctomycetales bacterium]
MRKLARRFTGPVCCLAGIALFVLQLRIFQATGAYHTVLPGLSLGLIAFGAMVWLYDHDDKHAPGPRALEEELPTADEFERRLEELDD